MGKWKKTSFGSSSGNQYYSPNPSFGRNLTQDQLGGVVFGTKNCTIKECLSKQLFGLPSVHFSYVKNIRPGLPLFLFNYSDRTLHGIFEAAGPGRMSIDRYAWTDDGAQVTPFPAQVQILVRVHCRPLTEDRFKPAIAGNYFVHNHFWFELDHAQTNRLIALMTPLEIPRAVSIPQNTTIAPAYSVPQNTNQAAASRSLPWHDPSWKDKTFKRPESESQEHRSTHSSMKSFSNESDLLDECFQPLDTHSIDREEAPRDEKDGWMKLKELVVAHENENFSWENHVSGTYATENWPDGRNENWSEERNENWTEGRNENWPPLGKNSEEKEENPSPPLEEENPSSPSEKEENSSSPLEENPSSSSEEENTCSPLEHQHDIAQLVREIKELMDFKKTHAERSIYLEQKLREAELEIQLLKDRCTLLESPHNTPLTHVEETIISPSAEETIISPSAELLLDAKDSLYLIGGCDGEAPLAAMDIYCPSLNAIKCLKPMNHSRSYASVVEFNGEIYVFGGGQAGHDPVWYDTVESYNPILDSWTLRPSLNQKKGSLSGAALDGKIFAVGGGNGVECFSDVEMFDSDIGRWIPTRSMLEKRFALAAVELNGAIYATGGFDGKNYLNSAERFDPREHSWFRIANMNTRRGCHSMAALNEKLYSLGGFDGVTMVPSVEVFDPRLGKWTVEETTMNHPRGYFAAAVVKDSIYVIGGVNGDETIVDTVESYKEGQVWKEIYTSENVKRCFISAIACSHE